jgi:hypothetical protein
MKLLFVFFFFSCLVFSQTEKEQTIQITKSTDKKEVFEEYKQILEELKNLEEFSLTKGMILDFNKDILYKSMSILGEEEVDDILLGFQQGMCLQYTNPHRILVFLQFQDNKYAQQFFQAEVKIMPEKDKVHSAYIKQNKYEQINEQTLIARKVIESEQMKKLGLKQEVTVLVSVNKNCVLEANFLSGNYSEEQLQKFANSVWAVISKPREAKKKNSKKN